MAKVELEPADLQAIVNQAAEMVKLLVDAPTMKVVQRIVEKTVDSVVASEMKKVLTSLPDLMPLPDESPLNAADKAWGFRFGSRGVMSAAQASEFLGVSSRTLFRLASDGKIRKGKHATGVNCYCRRAIEVYAADLEQ